MPERPVYNGVAGVAVSVFTHGVVLEGLHLIMNDEQ